MWFIPSIFGPESTVFTLCVQPCLDTLCVIVLRQPKHSDHIMGQYPVNSVDWKPILIFLVGKVHNVKSYFPLTSMDFQKGE